MMIRQPTPTTELFAWYRDALEGRAPVIEDDFHCGYFRTRFVKNGPFVPVRIECEQDVDEFGELTAPERFVAYVIHQRQAVTPRLWTRLRPIPEEHYRALLAEHDRGGPLTATHAPTTVHHLMQGPR